MKILWIHGRASPSLLPDIVKKAKECRVTTHSANLSYSFLFTLFPLLVIISYFVGKLELSSPTADLFMQNILPSQIYALIRSYLDNAGSIDLGQAISASALSIFSCVRIALSLREKICAVYGLPSGKKPLGEILVAVLFSVLLVAGIVLSLLILVAGEWLFQLLSQQIALNGFFVRLWLLARFALVGGFIFVLFFVLYRCLPQIPMKAGEVIAGTAFSSVAWVILSAAFSFYVDHLHDYSLLYGSVGVAIILLLWLYLTNLVLLIGACINACVRERTARKRGAS